MLVGTEIKDGCLILNWLLFAYSRVASEIDGAFAVVEELRTILNTLPIPENIRTLKNSYILFNNRLPFDILTNEKLQVADFHH